MDKISRKGAIIDLLALPLVAAAVGSVVTEASAATMMKDDSSGTKAQYKYVAKSKMKGKMCSNCALFKAPAGCQLVKGKISPAGYCTAYAKKG